MILGLGPSGQQVVEGWHGVPYGKPLVRTREYIEIMRKIFARTERVTCDGKEYQIPYRGAGAGGLGKPLRSILHGRADVPIVTATISPKGIELAAAVPDDLCDAMCLLGPKERIRDQVGAWKQSPATTPILQAPDRKTMDTLAELWL